MIITDSKTIGDLEFFFFAEQSAKHTEADHFKSLASSPTVITIRCGIYTAQIVPRGVISISTIRRQYENIWRMEPNFEARAVRWNYAKECWDTALPVNDRFLIYCDQGKVKVEFFKPFPKYTMTLG